MIIINVGASHHEITDEHFAVTLGGVFMNLEGGLHLKAIFNTIKNGNFFNPDNSSLMSPSVLRSDQ